MNDFYTGKVKMQPTSGHTVFSLVLRNRNEISRVTDKVEGTNHKPTSGAGKEVRKGFVSPLIGRNHVIKVFNKRTYAKLRNRETTTETALNSPIFNELGWLTP